MEIYRNKIKNEGRLFKAKPIFLIFILMSVYLLAFIISYNSLGDSESRQEQVLCEDEFCQNLCGDGFCQKWENEENCPIDCDSSHPDYVGEEIIYQKEKSQTFLGLNYAIMYAIGIFILLILIGIIFYIVYKKRKARENDSLNSNNFTNNAI